MQKLGISVQVRLRPDALKILESYPGQNPSEKILQMDSKIKTLTEIIIGKGSS